MSSLDADSEGGEGAYYVWDRDRVRALLDAAEYPLVARRFGLDRAPNFENEAWHLRIVEPFEATADALGIDPAHASSLWRSARARLLDARARRPRPGLDDKILTAWNALMISAAADAAARSDEFAPLLAAAERALDAVHAKLWRDGILYASHARGETKFPAYLDDHAFLLEASLAMLRLRWRRRDLDAAILLAETLLDRFEDGDRGGFFFTARDAEPLPQRPKPFMDESLPSGNGVAARALLRLGHLVGEPRYMGACERTLRAAWPLLSEYPEACPTLLLALGEFLDPAPHVVVRHQGDAPADAWRDAARAGAEDVAAYFVPLDERNLPGTLAAHAADHEVALLCSGTECKPPLATPKALAGALRDGDH